MAARSEKTLASTLCSPMDRKLTNISSIHAPATADESRPKVISRHSRQTMEKLNARDMRSEESS